MNLERERSVQKFSPILIALLGAIAIAGLHILAFPNFILDGLGIEPTGQSLRQALQIQTIDRLGVTHYQYGVAVLLAFATFGVIYFWQTLHAPGSWLIIGSCAVPLLSNLLVLFYFPVFLPLLTAIGLLIWLLIIGSKDPLFVPGCYSLGVNVTAAILLYRYCDDLWQLMT